MPKPIIKKQTKNKTGKRIVIGLLTLLLLLIGGAWVFGFFGRTNPALAEMQQLQAKMADPSLKDADRRALWGQMREKMNALSPEEREAARDAGRERFEKRMNQHIKDLLAMSKADQQKALDADIDRMEKREADRKAREAAAAAAAKNGTADQNNNGQNRQNRQRGGYRSEQDRLTRTENSLARTPAETRALRTQYNLMINARLQQRGLPALQPGRRFG